MSVSRLNADRRYNRGMAAATTSDEHGSAPLVDSFEKDAEDVLTHLRAALSRLVAAAPSVVKRATDLQRVLDVRTSLAWQVFRVATAKDPFDTVPHIPRAESMTKILEAARSKGFRDAASERSANVNRSTAPDNATKPSHG